MFVSTIIGIVIIFIVIIVIVVVIIITIIIIIMIIIGSPALQVTVPEILRSNLASVVLQMKAINDYYYYYYTIIATI